MSATEFKERRCGDRRGIQSFTTPYSSHRKVLRTRALQREGITQLKVLMMTTKKRTVIR